MRSVTTADSYSIMGYYFCDGIDASDNDRGLSIADRLPQVEIAVGEYSIVFVFRNLLPFSAADEKRLAELGHEIVPLAWAAAAPASYVTADAYERMWALFDEDLKKLGPFDAIYLDLHGAMVAENTEDGEGELLRQVRAVAKSGVARRNQAMPGLAHQRMHLLPGPSGRPGAVTNEERLG